MARPTHPAEPPPPIGAPIRSPIMAFFLTLLIMLHFYFNCRPHQSSPICNLILRKSNVPSYRSIYELVRDTIRGLMVPTPRKSNRKRWKGFSGVVGRARHPVEGIRPIRKPSSRPSRWRFTRTRGGYASFRGVAGCPTSGSGPFFALLPCFSPCGPSSFSSHALSPLP